MGCLGGVEMPPSDRVLLSSWEKWIRYGRFPLKLVLHVMLVVATTWQVVRFNRSDAAYIRAARRNFYYFFFPEEFDFSTNNFYLYSIQDMTGSVSRAVAKYDEIIYDSIDQLSHPTIDTGTCQAAEHCAEAKLDVLRFKKPPRELFPKDGRSSDVDDEKIEESFWISSKDLGPFSRPEHALREFVQSLVSARLTFFLVAHGPTQSGRSCLVWQVTLVYDFENRGQINLGLESQIVDTCFREMTFKKMLTYQVHRLNIVILALSIAILGLSIRSFVRSAQLLTTVRSRYQSAMSSRDRRWSLTSLLDNQDGDNSYAALQDSTHECPDHADGMVLAQGSQTASERPADLSFVDKLKFFKSGLILSTVGACLGIVNTTISLKENRMISPPDFNQKLLLGLGCAVLWFHLVTFLRHNSSYNTILLTLGRAVPRVGRFLFGVMPILLGYALFGMLYFGDHSERFGSFSMSMITLFSVLNGDVVRETFMDILPSFPYVTQVYMYSFICLFIYVVLNVFIAIVEESFFSTRATARSLETFAKQLNSESRNEEGNAGQHVATASATEGSTENEVARPGHRSYNTFHDEQMNRQSSSTSAASTSYQGARGLMPNDDGHVVREQRRLQWFRDVLDELGE